MSISKEKYLIGRREKVSFPDLDILDIEAKIDTGAYTCAIHCHDIKVENENGKNVLHFKLLDPSHPDYSKKTQTIEAFFQKEIKNSFGDSEKRYIIKTRIKIGRKIIKTSISLSDRAGMRYPVLLGRKVLKKRFIVDVAELYLLDPLKK